MDDASAFSSAYDAWRDSPLAWLCPDIMSHIVASLSVPDLLAWGGTSRAARGWWRVRAARVRVRMQGVHRSLASMRDDKVDWARLVRCGEEEDDEIRLFVPMRLYADEDALPPGVDCIVGHEGNEDDCFVDTAFHCVEHLVGSHVRRYLWSTPVKHPPPHGNAPMNKVWDGECGGYVTPARRSSQRLLVRGRGYLKSCFADAFQEALFQDLHLSRTAMLPEDLRFTMVECVDFLKAEGIADVQRDLHTRTDGYPTVRALHARMFRVCPPVTRRRPGSSSNDHNTATV